MIARAMAIPVSGTPCAVGLLFAAYFGLVVSIGRDTFEPLADPRLLGGLLPYRQRRFVLAALSLSYAVFANEPVLVFPALSLTRWWQVWRNSLDIVIPLALVLVARRRIPFE